MIQQIDIIILIKFFIFMKLVICYIFINFDIVLNLFQLFGFTQEKFVIGVYSIYFLYSKQYLGGCSIFLFAV